MFQPYMIIIRLANKKETKYILAFRIEISMLLHMYLYKLYTYQFG